VLEKLQILEITLKKYNIEYTGRTFNLLDGSTALRFMAAGSPLAVRRIQILPMNQHA
jgi:hypothetical protein